MDPQKVNFQHEPKIETDESIISNDENIGTGITKPNAEKSSSEFNGKQIEDQYFVSKTIKEEEINIKIEEEEGDKFSIEGFNEKQIQDVNFDSKSITWDESEIKTENEGGNEFSTKTLAELQPTNKVARLSEFFQVNSNSHHVNLEEPPIFRCLRCSYQTHKRRNISRHILSHMSKTFECPHCPYKSNNKAYWNSHKLVHIPKEEAKLHSCPQCFFTSKWRHDLNRHLLIHMKPDEITWHQCQECPFKTRHKRSLLYEHMKKHRKGQGIYKCTLCSYESPRKCHLQTHLKDVHGSTDIPVIFVQKKVVCLQLVTDDT